MNIARWDGSDWRAMGSGMNGAVTAFAVAGTNLFAGGWFTAVGGEAAHHVARWSGSAWIPLGSGMNGWVSTLAISGNDLYAGGDFTSAGGIAANYIAKWDGHAWSALGSGMDGYGVSALAVSGSDLYAGGYFTTAGGLSANSVAKWNGSTWSPLGSGLNDRVYSLAASGSDLYAGGSFTTASNSNGAEVTVNGVARWNGSAWGALGPGPGLPVFALVVSGNKLFAGGGTKGSYDGGGGERNGGGFVAEWSGSSWSMLGSMSPAPVHALAVSGGDLYAGGFFGMSDERTPSGIDRWNGSTWSKLGSGVNGPVLALAVSGSDLYAGGHFTMAGGKVSAYVTKAVINPPVLTLEHNASGTNFIRFSGVPGTAYHLQRAPTPTGPWPNIATNIAPDTGRLEIEDALPPPDKAFYRVVEP